MHRAYKQKFKDIHYTTIENTQIISYFSRLFLVMQEVLE